MGTLSSSAVVVCFCACPDRETARTIADALIDARLAACVQLLPGVESIYRWEARTERAEEVQLQIKTTRARLDALQARLLALHPYDVPELIVLQAVGGLPAYLHWVADETANPHAPDFR